MKKRILLYAILFCCGLAQAEDDIDAVRLHEKLLNAPELFSFSGVYDLEQQDEDGTIQWVERHEYRFQGEDMYLRRIFFGEIDRPPLVITRLNDRVSTLVERPCGFSADLVGPHWPNPWGSFINPKEIFGEFHGKNRRDMLASAQFQVFLHDGLPVLSIHPDDQDEYLEYHFDEDGQVVLIETVMRHELAEEEVEALWTGDRFDLRQMILSLHLYDFFEVNGVKMPMKVVKKWWWYDRNRYFDYRELARNGEISWTEAFIKNLKNNIALPYTIQTFTLHPETVMINVPLRAADFQLSIPPGTMVREKHGEKIYVAAAIPMGFVSGSITRFLAELNDTASMNKTYGSYFNENTMLISMEPLPQWVKPALIAVFVGIFVLLFAVASIRQNSYTPEIP